ncbi:MAG: flavodoxin family protein [Bacillota bacterium]|nr:flavodoxin family protein [Bacillota bacterium]
MNKAVAINGSPRMERGYTAMVLAPFIEGLMDAGSDVETFYTGHLKIKPCACGEMYCWYKQPGECCLKDDMQMLYPKVKRARILILATPVYMPLPGQMQDFVNRLCPLVEPFLQTRGGRTRARFREDVQIRKIVLVSTGGWWEKGNFDTVVHITQELAENAGVEFAGAVIRPHAFLMKKRGQLTEEGKAILDAVRRAGYDLVKNGMIAKETFDAISRPLLSEDELRDRYNGLV